MFEATLTYMNTKSSTEFTIHTTEEEFDILVYGSSITSSQAKINIETNPAEKIDALISSTWSYSCVNSKDQTACDTSILTILNNHASLKSKSFVLSLSGSYRSINLSLQINGRIGTLQLTFPEDENVPIISVLSVSPQRTLITTAEVLELNLLVTLNGQVEEINSQITRDWTLNGHAIPSSMLLYGSDISLSNKVLLDISQLTQGTSHNLAFTVSRSSKSSTYTYSFTVAVNPTACSCSISPQTGYFLETDFTIYCPNCLQPDNTLQISFLDFKTGLKIPLIESSTSSFKTNLPFTGGSESVTLYFVNKNTQTNAKAESSITKTLSLPIGFQNIDWNSVNTHVQPFGVINFNLWS